MCSVVRNKIRNENQNWANAKQKSIRSVITRLRTRHGRFTHRLNERKPLSFQGKGKRNLNKQNKSALKTRIFERYLCLFGACLTRNFACFGTSWQRQPSFVWFLLYTSFTTQTNAVLATNYKNSYYRTWVRAVRLNPIFVSIIKSSISLNNF